MNPESRSCSLDVAPTPDGQNQGGGGDAVACWVPPGASSEQARNRPPLSQCDVFPSTSGLRKLPAASQSCQSGGGALSDRVSASAWVSCVPGHRPPALRRERTRGLLPHTHLRDPTFTLRFQCPVLQGKPLHLPAVKRVS